MSATTKTRRKTDRSLDIDFKQDEGDLIVQVPMAASGVLMQMGETLLNQEMTNDVARYFNRTTAPYVRFPKIFEIVDEYVELLPQPGSEAEYAAVLRWLDHHHAATEPDEAQAQTPRLYNNIREKRELVPSFRESGDYSDILNWDHSPWSNVVIRSRSNEHPLEFMIRVKRALEEEGHPDLARHFAENAVKWERYIRTHPEDNNRYKYEWLAIAHQYVVLAVE